MSHQNLFSLGISDITDFPTLSMARNILITTIKLPKLEHSAVTMELFLCQNRCRACCEPLPCFHDLQPLATPTGICRHCIFLRKKSFLMLKSSSYCSSSPHHGSLPTQHTIHTIVYDYIYCIYKLYILNYICKCKYYHSSKSQIK